MSTYHRNVFNYYRGASRKPEDRGQQLEDNTTKALVNVLSHCSPGVALAFLKWLRVPAEDPPSCELQRDTIGEGLLRRKTHRLLLGIAPEKLGTIVRIPEATRGSGGSRPDAWLHGDDYAVLIESKVVGRLDLDQLNRHQRTLQAGSRQTPRFQELTWAELHRFFLDLRSGVDGKDEWLVGQFVEHLAMNGLADFTGFEAGIFDFHVTTGRKDRKRWEDHRRSLTALRPILGGYLRASEPVCVLGDLNQRIPRERQPVWAFELLQDTFRGFTFATTSIRDPSDRLLIDHIAGSPALQCRITRCIARSDADGVRLSDHSGVASSLFSQQTHCNILSAR